MKKGFLLSKRDLSRANNNDAPSLSELKPLMSDVDGGNALASNTHRMQKPPLTMIKRGFLLNRSKPDSLSRRGCSSSTLPVATLYPPNNDELSLLPQCRLNEKRSLTGSRSSRVTTRSTALLATSYATEEDGGHNNKPYQPLLCFVNDESDTNEGETPPARENNFELTQHEGRFDDANPSLDNWIEPSSSASSLPSIILPSSNHHSISSESTLCTSKQRKPLIVEMNETPMIRGASTNDNSMSLIHPSSKDVAEFHQTDYAIDNEMEEVDPIRPQQHLVDSDSGCDFREAIVPTAPKDSRQIISAVSILLSKLGRAIHSKSNHHKNSQRDSNRGTLVIGIGTIINISTETLIRSFVTRQRRDTRELLDNIWQMILEPIAQHYTEFIQSRSISKKRSRSSNVSPSLALGLGMLEFVKPTVMVYDSLVRHLLLLETIEACSNQDTQDRQGQLKHQKILALGAVYLLRCRIRCISISLTNLEKGSEVDPSHSDIKKGTSEILNNLEPELGILLSKILPSLESVVNGNRASVHAIGQTVLTSAAADACFELIEISSISIMRHQRLQFSNNNADEITASMKKWKGVLSLIERLLAVKQRWVASSAMSSQSDGKMEMNGCSSRSICATAVVDDWLDVIKSAKRLYFDYFFEDGLLEGYNYPAGLALFFNLSGILLRKTGVSDSSEIPYLRLGGIAQSLCQHKECILSSIIGPVYGSDGDVVTFLHESSTKRGESENSLTAVDAFTRINHQRVAVRAFASWISSGNKAIRILTKSNQNSDADKDSLDSSMVSLVMLLRSESNKCVDLSIAALTMIWSAYPDWMPQSFEDLLDALHAHTTQSFDENGTQSIQSHNDELVLSPTCRALCMVVANAASRNPTILLPSILKMKGRIELMIEVVLKMLEMLPTNPSPGDANYSIFHAASDILLENISSVPHLRSRLRSNSSLYTNVPYILLVPKIVVYLVDRYAKRKSDAGVSSLAGVLCNIMQNSVECGRAEEIMRCIVSSLQNIDENDTNPASESSTTFFNKNGPLWRLALCNNASTSDSAYRYILLAAARTMIEVPTSSTPLAALASLVDNEFDGRSSTSDAEGRVEKRIFLATSGIIHFSMNELSSPCKEDGMSIFSRLAPLLILRRVPRSYYRVVHSQLSSDKDTRHVMMRLAAHLADTLKTLAVKSSPSSLDTEQKKLIAELLGHCLPLTSRGIDRLYSSSDSNELHVSLYDNICKAIFSHILKSLRVDHDNMTKIDSDNIRMSDVSQAKAVLYALCHHVPLAMDEDDGEELINVATFVFGVLNCQPAAANGTTTNQIINEITMLQSGCAHFLAVCVDSLSYRKANIIEAVNSTPLIVDLAIQKDSRDSQVRNTITGALLQIFNEIVTIITTGESNTGVNRTAMHILPSCRTLMLNSIVMLVQSSKADDTRLHWLASTLLPPLVGWTSNGPIDEDIHHRLCLAASLQVIYTLLARCGTFDWLPRKTHPGLISETDFVCRTLQCALTSFHTSGTNDAPATTALRLASLKVILTVLALHQSAVLGHSEQDLKGYLSPMEIQKAISAMHGAANVDQNPEVRRLANQILPHIMHL